METAMREGYSVTVSRWGEPILTMERAMLSGQPAFSPEDEEAIRDAGDHLKSFIGEGSQRCFLCGGVHQCRSDCQPIKGDS